MASKPAQIGRHIAAFADQDRVVELAKHIEKDIYEEMADLHILDGDILLASTGTGTLGKAGVYNLNRPAVVDSHVAIIRVDKTVVDPYFLADYLRIGAGADQIERLYTGSTGLIELQPADVDQILVALPPSIKEQKAVSEALRAAEAKFQKGIVDAQEELAEARFQFSKKAI